MHLNLCVWKVIILKLTCYLIATGLQADAGKFFLFMLGLFAQSLVIGGIVHAIAAYSGVLSAAQTILNMVIIFSFVCFCVCI